MDAEAAIWRMTSDDPWIRQKERYPAAWNSKAKLAAKEQDSHGVEWLRFRDHLWRNVMPLPHSLANLKHAFPEAKWNEAKQWSHSRINQKKYRRIPAPAGTSTQY